MLIIDRIRTIVITPPKCGSSSAHYRWAKDDVGGFWVLGPQPDGSIGKHTAIPLPHWGYRTAAIIREPYTRGVSLWNHRKNYHDIDTPLEEFLVELPRSDNWFEHPYTSILPPVDEYWPLELIDGIAEENGLPHLPVLNTGNHPVILTEKQREQLDEWVKDDLEIYTDALLSWSHLCS